MEQLTLWPILKRYEILPSHDRHHRYVGAHGSMDGKTYGKVFAANTIEEVEKMMDEDEEEWRQNEVSDLHRGW